MSDILKDFFTDHDVESLRVLGLEQYGIDIAGVYCLQTGRQIGTFDDFVIQFACDEESADNDEELVDALVTRCVASMRPSPMLNKPDRLTLRNLADKYPVDILSFLVNRLHGNRWLATHRVSDDSVSPYIARIKTHAMWTKLAAAGIDLAPWIHWLLELDAKRNLHDLTPPSGTYVPASHGKSMRFEYSPTGESYFAQITEFNVQYMLEEFERWTFQRIQEFDRRDKQALAQQHWMRGNSMTQTAYVRSWLENPQFASKRAEAEAKAKKTPAKIKVEKPKSKLDAKVSQFLHLLDDIIDAGSEPVTPIKKGPVIRTGASLSFLRKKESN